MTFTAYDAAHDKPAVVTNAQGFTSCYKYDSRGRKIAEWGTALQPACFGYDDRDNMVSLSTFRAGDETITTDPSERTDKDTTTWIFHPLTGAELSKTYADNTSVTKTYDAYNRLATETDARGNVKTHSYEQLRGLHIGTTYSDGTTARSYSYNHLGQPTQVTDDSGTRTFGYNSYGERISDSLSIDSDTHLITESLDAMGRSTGFVYSKNGAAQHTVTTGYGTDGRINSAGFLHGGAEKVFGYEYLIGSNLLHKLTKPNGMTLTQSYEEHRNLLTGMAYHRGTTLVANRQYSYDTLGRPTARNTARKGTVVNDTFAHNTRSELTAAQVNGEDYQYNYDNIGNRTTATEGDESTTYTANALNQYTAIQENAEAAFTPLFDADGNQTRIKTETGIWEVINNAENRPVSFTNAESNTVVECAYDSMGRRAYKKVTVNGNITLHQRYIYRGYLQIAALDLTRSNHPALWFITWDPTQPIATRPLSIRINGTWYTYGWDLTKNICELYSTGGGISTSYTYTPFGKVTSSGNVSQPIQWSSEYDNAELGIIYFNWRYYNTINAIWQARDSAELYSLNLYAYSNMPISHFDILGRYPGFGGPGEALQSETCGYKQENNSNLRDLCFLASFSLLAEGCFAGTTASTKSARIAKMSYDSIRDTYLDVTVDSLSGDDITWDSVLSSLVANGTFKFEVTTSWKQAKYAFRKGKEYFLNLSRSMNIPNEKLRVMYASKNSELKNRLKKALSTITWDMERFIEYKIAEEMLELTLQELAQEASRKVKIAEEILISKQGEIKSKLNDFQIRAKEISNKTINKINKLYDDFRMMLK